MYASMNAAGVLAVLLVFTTARARAFVLPPSTALDKSCLCSGGSMNGTGGEARSPQRCRRDHQRGMSLFSRRCRLPAHPYQRRRRCSSGFNDPPLGISTAIMSSRCCSSSSNGSAEDEEPWREQHRHRPRSPQQYEQCCGSQGSRQTRADFLRTGVSVAGFGAAVLGTRSQAARAIDLGGVEFGFKSKNKFNIPDEDNPDRLRSPRPLAYRVEYTDPPTTVPFPREFEPDLVKEISGQRLVFFGVHGENAADQDITAEVMGKVSKAVKDKAAIGLEQVEMQFQPALDDYIAGGKEKKDLASADAELARATQWEERCAFPFENFLPLFHLARSRGLPLVALGVDSEKVFGVMQNGMESLEADDRNAYVSDFKGFVTYVRDKGFQVYADRLIFPTYDRLNKAGLLGSKPPTKPNFFAARILADEALASKAVNWAMENAPMKLLVVQREDHVKFGFGASGRAARISQNLGTEMSTKSVLVNPTAEDTLSLSRSLRLALEYADDLQNGKPVANYLWFSKSPKANMIPRMVNPEDKGWLESVNLYDFKGASPG